MTTDQELLDMFACAAMQGILSHMGEHAFLDDGGRLTASKAYDMAELMLASRKKRYG